MSNDELTNARRDLAAAVRERQPSTWPLDALKAVTHIIRMAPPIPPSPERGRARLVVVP